jgi:enoyl-CoA hydratase/carnithine racemase
LTAAAPSAATDADAGGPPQLALEGPRATITLARPRHLNRLHAEDLDALQAHLAAVAATPGLRVLVLTGQGRAFSAGFHLDELRAASLAGMASDVPRRFEQAVEALAALPLPTIARLNGGVYGGAVDLALACDFRLGVDTLEARMPAARIGLHYYASGLARAVARLGVGGARRLFLVGETLDAAALRQLGFVDDCVPAAGLDARVDALATALAAAAPLAVQGMKRSLGELALGHADPATLREREARCAASADLREGLAALAERRSPRFTGS